MERHKYVRSLRASGAAHAQCARVYRPLYIFLHYSEFYVKIV